MSMSRILNAGLVAILAALGAVAFAAAGASDANATTNIGVYGFSRFGNDPDYSAATFGRGRVTFSLSFFVTNGPADNVVLTDTLPSGVTFVFEDLGGGVYDPTSNTVTWNLGTISRGPAEGLFRLVVNVGASPPDGAVLTNILSISTTTPQTTTADDSVSDQFQVGYLPVTVFVDPGTFRCSATATGEPNSSNQGPGSCRATEPVADVGATLSIGGSGILNDANDLFVVDFGMRGFADSGLGHASAGAEAFPRIKASNPNPYGVRLRTVLDQVESSNALSSGCEDFSAHGSAETHNTRTADYCTVVAGTFYTHADEAGSRTEKHTIYADGTSDDQSSDSTQPTPPCEAGPVAVGGFTTTILSPGLSGQASADARDPSTGFGDGAFSGRSTIFVTRCDGGSPGGATLLTVTAHSPVALLVTDPGGHRVGFDTASGRPVNEIFGASYTSPISEPQIVTLLRPLPGKYDIEATGTGTGPFTIDIETLDGKGQMIDSVSITGMAAPGSSQPISVGVTSAGRLSGGRPDSTPPTTVAALSPSPNGAGWNNRDVMVTLTATDNAGGSGVKDVHFSLSGAQVGSGVVAGNSAVVPITAEGTTTLTYFSTDNAGNVETAKTQIVAIDKTPPVISGLPAPGCTIWPPNHALVQVANVTAADALSGVSPGSLAVVGTSNESSVQAGSGRTSADVVITGTTVQVRAERSGAGTGRVYTLTATARDVAGNSATAKATCTVPHDQGQ